MREKIRKNEVFYKSIITIFLSSIVGIRVYTSFLPPFLLQHSLQLFPAKFLTCFESTAGGHCLK